jgi:hypothetical protein
MRQPVSRHYLTGRTMKRTTDAILQILMGMLLAVMAAQTYTAGPNVSSPILIGMASVAVAVAVRELRGRRQEASISLQREGEAPAEPRFSNGIQFKGR